MVDVGERDVKYGQSVCLAFVLSRCDDVCCATAGLAGAQASRTRLVGPRRLRARSWRASVEVRRLCQKWVEVKKASRSANGIAALTPTKTARSSR